jgi:hypothetical protein
LKITTYPGSKLKGKIVTFSNGTKIYFGLTNSNDPFENNWLEREFWSFDIVSKKWERYGDFPYLPTDNVRNLFFFNYHNSLYFGYGLSNYTIWKFDTSKE